jgi:hypothetical protein
MSKSKKKAKAKAKPQKERTAMAVSDIKLTIQSETKNVSVHIQKPDECAQAAAGSVDGELLSDLNSFCEDILEQNDDAAKLDITPENAAEVLTSKHPAVVGGEEPPEPGDGEESEDEQIAG